MREPAQRRSGADSHLDAMGWHRPAGRMGGPAMLMPTGVQMLQRTAGNRATTRLLLRMTAAAAATAAREDGCTDTDIDTRTAGGERWDFVAKLWVTPEDEALWDKWHAGMRRAPEPRRVVFTTWAAGKQPAPEAAAKAAAAKKPIDIDDDAQLAALWGTSARFNRDDRVAFLRLLFATAGHEIKKEYEAKRSGAVYKPVILEIDHPLITMIEIHPGGGSQHKGAYLRLSTSRGMVKVINSALLPAYDPKGENVLKYVDIARAEAPPMPTSPAALTSPVMASPQLTPSPAAVTPTLTTPELAGSTGSLKEED